MPDSIKENLNSVAQKLKDLKFNGKLVVVTKKKPVSDIELLYQLGHRDFGENYVQEWQEKSEQLQVHQDIRWHFIGQLQSNKVKYLVGKVDFIHSVDSLKLLKEINKRAEAQAVVQKVLIQVSFDAKESRGGISPVHLEEVLEEARELQSIDIKGLMCVPPIEDGAKASQFYFEELKKLLLDSQSKTNFDLTELSMGMSGDYQEAVKAGASILRLGSVILGKR